MHNFVASSDQKNSKGAATSSGPEWVLDFLSSLSVGPLFVPTPAAEEALPKEQSSSNWGGRRGKDGAAGAGVVVNTSRVNADQDLSGMDFL